MKVFRRDNEYIYLNVSYCEFYIPMYFYNENRKFAQECADSLKLLGICDVGIFENGKLKEMRTLNLPTFINIFVYDSEIRDVVLRNGSTEKCKVIKYLKDAKIMSAVLFQNDSYSKDYLQYILGAKLPKTIPYSKALEIWRKNQRVNKVYFGVSSTYLELVLASIHRNPNNMSEKFAYIAGNEEVGDYDYKLANTRQICQYNSTFSAITYEDIDSMITTSLNKARDKSKETISPVEQIIKF